MKGKYYVIEGQDGTGKSTQAELLADFFRTRNKPVITIHEPDGDLPSAQALRTIIKDKQYDLNPYTHVLLFTAARNELWHKLAEPCLKSGGVVISARNWWSTLAYQGYGQGVNIRFINSITTKCLPPRYFHPDHCVILTLSEQERTKRLQMRDDNSSKDTFESKPDAFQKTVTDSYLTIATEKHITTLDASPSETELHQQILSLFNLYPQA